MATAEKLIHEAYFAFNNISYGDTPSNGRNRRRATSLCRKILRKYPGTMEAAEAHAILMRLGEESYQSQLAERHRHIAQSEHHGQSPQQTAPTAVVVDHEQIETLNWAGLVRWLVSLPRAVLLLIAFVAFVLFGILGPILFVPLILLVLFTGPFRGMLKPEQRRKLNEAVAQINRHLEQQSV